MGFSCSEGRCVPAGQLAESGDEGEGEEEGTGEGEAGGEGEGEAPVECIDGDEDGYDTCPVGAPGGDDHPVDCHDGIRVINPGAQEMICTGIDEDCDGLDDDHPDLDGDEHDVCDVEVEGADEHPADCDDSLPSVYPGAVEVICNGQDEDCDGLDDDHPNIDEDAFDACPLGAEGADDLVADCDDEDRDRYPGAAEICNGLDDSCDGVTDFTVDCEGLFCVDGGCQGDIEDDPLEDNDSRAEARHLAPGIHQPLAYVLDDHDWYAVSVCLGGRIEVDMLFDHAAGDIELALYSTDGRQVQTSFTSDDDEHVEDDTPEAGWWYLKVWSIVADQQNVYALRIATPGCGCIHACPSAGATSCDAEALLCVVGEDGCLQWQGPDPEACE